MSKHTTETGGHGNDYVACFKVSLNQLKEGSEVKVTQEDGKSITLKVLRALDANADTPLPEVEVTATEGLDKVAERFKGRKVHLDSRLEKGKQFALAVLGYEDKEGQHFPFRPVSGLIKSIEVKDIKPDESGEKLKNSLDKLRGNYREEILQILGEFAETSNELITSISENVNFAAAKVEVNENIDLGRYVSAFVLKLVKDIEEGKEIKMSAEEFEEIADEIRLYTLSNALPEKGTTQIIDKSFILKNKKGKKVEYKMNALVYVHTQELDGFWVDKMNTKKKIQELWENTKRFLAEVYYRIF